MPPEPTEKPEPDEKPKVTNMTDYQGRDRKRRGDGEPAPERKVEKVVVGEVVVQKKTFGRKAKDAVVAADFKSVGGYLIWDVLIPAIKNTIVDTVTNGIERAIYGERSTRTRRNILGNRESRVTLYPYNQHHRGERDRAIEARSREVGSRRELERRGSDGLNFFLSNREDASRVLDEMQEIIELQGFVTVADLKELLGVESFHTDNKYGWTSMRDIKDYQSRDGHVIDFPAPVVV